VWRSTRPRRWDYLAIAALLGFASFRVSRLDAFFAIVIVILLAPNLVETVGGLLTRLRRAAKPVERPTAVPRAGILAITLATVAVMLVPAAPLIGKYATCLSIGGAWAPDEEAARFIRLNRLEGRMLTWFDWGEYAIWHFGPALQVSMDGRRETVYTDDTIQAHWRFYAGETTGAYVSALQPDYIWLPTRLPVTDQLAAEGWVAVFQGAESVVFARQGAGPFQAPRAASALNGTRCFPGL
jgi:amino acid transporter